MISVLGIVLSGMINSFTCHYIWRKLSSGEVKFKSLKFLLSFVLLAVLLFVNYYFNNNYIKVFSITFCYFFILRLLFIKDSKKSAVIAIFTELLFMIAEILFVILFVSILQNAIATFVIDYFGTLLSNFGICLISVLLVNIPLTLKLYKLLLNATNKIKISFLFVLVSILIISLNLILSFVYYTVNTGTILVINILLIIIYSYIVMKFIQAKNRYIDISDKYSLTESSLKELQSNVNRLMTVNHENKNQLLTIRTMVANKDKDALKNIDAIINRKVQDDKELKIRTSVISNTMLGALIYSKLLTMKEKSIKYDLHIDKSLNKTDFINLGDKTNVDICKIIGVYLDNAIEAVEKVEEKEINIDLYSDNGILVVGVANTFDGIVDLGIINNYGYTTKSEGHGYGLSLAREVIKENNCLSSETEVIGKVFAQKLKIKM